MSHLADEIDALCACAPERDRPSDVLLYAADAVRRAHAALGHARDTCAALASAGVDVPAAPATPLQATLVSTGDVDLLARQLVGTARQLTHEGR